MRGLVPEIHKALFELFLSHRYVSGTFPNSVTLTDFGDKQQIAY
jgi:hypothetical protein